MEIKFTVYEKGSPPGKLADAELHFTEESVTECACGGAGEVQDPRTDRKSVCTMCGGTGKAVSSPLAGMKLVGFAVWERRGGGGRNVTFPSRQFVVHGERRSFSLLRPLSGDMAAQERIRDLILKAFSAFEETLDDAQESTSRV